MTDAALAVAAGIVAGVLLIATFIVGFPSFLQTYPDKVTLWNQMTMGADCRDAECAFQSMVACKNYTSSALYGNGDNATVIRVTIAKSPTHNTDWCAIDVVTARSLSNYTYDPFFKTHFVSAVDYSFILKTKAMDNWHMKSLAELLERLHQLGPISGATGQFDLRYLFSKIQY